MDQPHDSILTARVLRTETLYRTAVRGTAAVDCGFILKPTADRGYHRRILSRYVAVYVLRGAGVFAGGDGREHRVEAGCVIQHQPGERCTVVPDGDGRWAEFFVVAPVELHAALTSLGSLEARTPVLRPGVDAGLVAQCETLLEAARNTAEVHTSAVLVRVHELLAAFQRLHDERLRPPQHVDAMTQARAWLDDDLHKNVDVAHLAARLNLSYERFRKLFREHVGLPPGEYRIRRRVDAARALIAQGGLTNKQVAYRLGYPDPFTFSKQFKRYVGLSPAAFRRTV